MCLFPKLIQNRKYISNKKNGGIVPVPIDKRVLQVPVGCGKCMECRKQKSRQWQARLENEVKVNDNGKFVTLTFTNESIAKLAEEANTEKVITGIKKVFTDKNGKIRKRYNYNNIVVKNKITGYDLDNKIAKIAVRSFLERWRKKYGKSLRHWLVTELGHSGTEHLHLHGIVWTNESLDDLEKIWSYGYVWKGKGEHLENYVNEKTVRYLVKYVSKDDQQHKEYNPIILASAGIGNQFCESFEARKIKYNGNNTIEYYKTRTGHKIALPIYWRNKLFSEEEREKLWLQKLDKQERWILGERIDISQGEQDYYEVLDWYRAKNKRLGYGDDSKNWDRIKYKN